MSQKTPGVRRWTLTTCLAFAALGCGGPLKYAVRGNTNAVGADADIVARVNKEQSNTRLDITAKHLPPPDRVQAGTSAYVVWQRRDASTQWSRVGTLAFNPDSRLGELREVSVPEVAFEMEITAEADAIPGSPSGQAVFSQQIGK